MRRLTLLALLATVLATPAPARAQFPSGDIQSEWFFDASPAAPGTTVRAALRFTIPKGYHVHSDRPLDEFLIPTALTVTPPEGFTVRRIVYPKPILISVQFSDEPLSVFETRFVIGVVMEIDDDAAAGRYDLEASIRYQACDDLVCLAPTTRTLRQTLEIAASRVPAGGGAAAVLDEVEFGDPSSPAAAEPPAEGDPTAPDDGAPSPVPPAETGPSAAEACDVPVEIDGFDILGTAGGYLGAEDFLEFIDQAERGTVRRNPLQGKGPLAIIVLVVLGGIALNLTPCVLPLIPINLGIIGAGVEAKSRGRGFVLGAAYGLAMAAVYGGLGLVVILTAGTFGGINSTIWFNVAIAVLFVVLALAMFDIVHIDFSRFQGKLDVSRYKSSGTLALAFGMGAVTALLAGACVAPVVIQVIVYSSDQYARGITAALALPFFLGIGMALPWPFAGAGLSFLPRPGRWMNRVKQAFGVLILVFAVYYGSLALGIYRAGRNDGGMAAAGAHTEPGWTPSICDGLETAREQDRLVLVDMWATWCKNCLAMDSSTFKDPRVSERLDDFVKVKFQAEDLETPTARELLERFEGIGLPTYAVLRPADRPRAD